MNHYYQNIHGWFDYEEIIKLAIDKATDGAKFVEIGAFKGKSGAFAGVEILNSGKKIMLNLVDHFKGNTEHLDVKSTWYESELAQNPEYLFELCTKNLEPVKDVVNIIRKSSVQAAKQFKANSVDFVFIDGSHDTVSVCLDIDTWYPKLKVGGIIAGHDYKSHREVEIAVNSRFPIGVHKRGASWLFYKEGEFK
jgi:hypothetical protein